MTRNWHAAAGLLKLFLRELTPPLLSFELYPFFLACGGSDANAMVKLGTLADLLGRLPDSTLRSVSLVLSLLHDTSVLNAVMTAAELAKVFAPLLLRPPNGGSPPADERLRAEAALTLMISNGASGGAMLTSAAAAAPKTAQEAANANASMSAIGQQMAGMSVGGAPAPASAAPDTTQWYYIDAQQNYVGPVDTHGLKQLKKHGYVNDETYVWAESLAGWQRLSTLPQMQAAAAAVPPPLPPAAPAPPAIVPPSQPSQPARPSVPSVPSVPQPAAPAVTSGRSSAASLSIPAVPRVAQPSTVMASSGVAAPPSLGLRARQASDPPASKAAGVPAQLAGLGGAKPVGGPPSAPLVLPGAGRASAAVPPPAAKAAASPAAEPTPPASASPKPPPPQSRGSGIFVPKPIMSDAQGEWSSASGMRIVVGGATKKVRATIAEDGEVLDGTGNTLAYIESNGEVGDPGMNFVGRAHGQAHQVIDHDDHVIGEFDPGRGYVKDAQGSVVAELNKEGTIKDNAGQTIGIVEGFTYSKMVTMAAYFLLVDRELTHGRGVVGRF